MIKNIISKLQYQFSLLPKKILVSELQNQGDYVIILHGIARSNKHMSNLAKFLTKNNFDIINLTYPSTLYKIEELVDLINSEISHRITKNKPTHFIGYSMGGLIVRALINKYQYKNLEKVVQLATPNHGSEIADLIKNFWLYKKIFGPAGQELTTDQTEIQHLFGQVNYQLGIIAGNTSIDPISSIIIPGENDGKVAVERTKLEGMKDHIVINASHTLFPSNKMVQKQTLYFLKNGKFKH